MCWDDCPPSWTVRSLTAWYSQSCCSSVSAHEALCDKDSLFLVLLQGSQPSARMWGDAKPYVFHIWWEWIHSLGAITHRSDLLTCWIMDELFQVKRGRHCRSSGKDCDWHEATGFVNWIGSTGWRYILLTLSMQAESFKATWWRQWMTSSNNSQDLSKAFVIFRIKRRDLHITGQSE